MIETNSRLPVCALVMALLCAFGGDAAAQRDRAQLSVSQFPIVGDEGRRIANHPVAANLADGVEKMPGVVVVGNSQGTVTLTEFYDLNCPYCRAAAADIGDMVDTDSQFRLVLVPFPVLGIASIQAARVELAIAKLGTSKQFYDFHRRIYSRRGLVDATRALEVARELAFDQEKLVAMANSEEITDTMKAHVRLGEALGLAATPSFIIKGVAVLGYPGRHALQALVDSASDCGKIVC